MAWFRSASQISMNLLVSFLLLIFFISFDNHFNISVVDADKGLIEQECHNAEVPEICLQCLNSNPESEKADKIGIVSILMDCMSKRMESMTGNMSSLASSGKDDKYLQSICKRCIQLFSKAKNDLSTAETKLKSGDYDGTNNLVLNALNKKIICQNNLPKSETEYMYDILFDMNIYEELSGATMRIIDGF